MHKSTFLIAGAVVALTASPALAQSASGSSSSTSFGGSVAIAPPSGGAVATSVLAGNASTGNAQASSVFVPGPGLVQTVTTNSSSIGGSQTTSLRLGVGGLAGAFGTGFGAGSGTGSAP